MKSGQQLADAFDKLVKVPHNRRVAPEWNQGLTAQMTEAEVEGEIKSLQRLKASGPDGLSNDFFKDCENLWRPHW